MDEELQHAVTLTKDFWLGKYPVTQAQWQAVMGNNPSYFQGDAQRSVDTVSWNDCQRFLQKLNAQGRGEFRLPTEAEWEYACRAGSTKAFCFGDNESQLAEYAWYKANSGNKTHPVGQKSPNAWGLHDMHGNLCEWCQDWYGTYSHDAVTDPTGASSGQFRVTRGGSFGDNPLGCRAANRCRLSPDSANNVYSGFRLLRIQS
jgi:formylglycine-generating enzyme required for sulfatase activity